MSKLPNIGVVIPGRRGGGVGLTIRKLVKGLRLEGFNVRPISLEGRNLLSVMCLDGRSLPILCKFDILIYMGSIPYPSHIFISDCGKIILFVHGFVKQELINAIKKGRLRSRIRAISLLTLYDISRLIDKVDLFICRSLTSCEMNRIYRNYVLLPEFIFQEEVKLYDELAREFGQNDSQNNVIKMLTYTSHADSPRLLNVSQIVRLLKHVSQNIKRNIILTVVDPKIRRESIESSGNLIVKYSGFMPKDVFLRELANSDMFIELCIDEELRNTSIEAGLMGTPIAKLTHTRFIERSDYGEDCLIHANTCREFIHEIIDYLDNLEYYKHMYSKNMRNFILKHRTWDVLKESLVNYLKSK